MGYGTCGAGGCSPDIRASCLGPGEKCLLFLLTEAVLRRTQEQGVVVPAGKGVLSSCGPFPGVGSVCAFSEPSSPHAVLCE